MNADMQDIRGTVKKIPAGKQSTIRSSMKVSGIGLHTGNMTTVEFKPADPGTGIVFVRTDLPGNPLVRATVDNVLDIKRGTTIGAGGVHVHTVEHVLASCYALRIDNMIINMDSNEPPVLDGSSIPYVRVLEEAGMVAQNAPRYAFRITQPVRYASEGTVIEAFPTEKDLLRISCEIIYNHPVIQNQKAVTEVTGENFKKEIASARTFCFDFEVEALQRRGLAKGGTLKNAIVIGLDGFHCDGNLRFPDEFVRHKILDLIGDLSLISYQLYADIRAVRSGHGHNINFAKKIYAFFQEAAVEKETEDKQTAPAKKAVPQKTGLEGKMLSIQEIQKIIPHRYPFLMIDRVQVIEDLKKAVGYKYVSGNEHFFQGHFPERPVMPGVLIVEAMAQTSCVLFLSRPDLSHKLAFFMGINEVKFRKPVEPGVVLELRVEVLRAREKGGKIRGEAFIGEDRVCEAEFMFALVDKE